jgi:hypothetical protein
MESSSASKLSANCSTSNRPTEKSVGLFVTQMYGKNPPIKVTIVILLAMQANP